MRKLFICFLVLSFGVLGCSKKADKKSSKKTNPGKVSPAVWKSCDSVAECATVSVPVNYEDSGDGSITIAMARIPAKSEQEKIGSLFVNPGGPGASGIESLSSIASLMPDDLLNKFDIVGFDPRGVGDSEQVACDQNLDYLFTSTDHDPDSAAEEAELADGYERFVESCKDETDLKLLKNLGTFNVARDLDRMRQAVGDSELSYLGFSYGTAIGQAYAKLFPKNIRAIALDGVIDPSLEYEEYTIAQAEGFDAAAEDFFAWCNQTDCLAGADARDTYTQVAEQSDSDPIKNDDGRELSPTLLDLGFAYYLYGGEAAWSLLGDAIGEAAGGSPDGFIDGADSYLGRDSSGIYDGSYASFLSIGCTDSPSPGTFDDLADISDQAAQAAPQFGRASAFLSTACVFWPTHNQFPPQEIHAPSAPPILVITTTGDPATPVEWGRAVAASLDSGVLVEYDGSGHTAFGSAGSDCVDDAAAEYLVNLTYSSRKISC